MATCPECNGEGQIIACVDDLCHGGGICIHDEYDSCRTCAGIGEIFDDDEYLDEWVDAQESVCCEPLGSAARLFRDEEE